MYLIDQEIANQIARTTPMKYPEMKKLFLMKEAAADRWEMNLRNKIEKQEGEEVARVVAVYLPLYLENQAITRFLRRTKAQSLRMMMPEILTVEEMIYLAQQDLKPLNLLIQYPQIPRLQPNQHRKAMSLS
jgi:hypothetical protein